ncbi:hypothetical protein SAMN06265360_114103 [Haloechinothrix alba]|uniref:Uncharacterized protein n=1 Tax=Haloechinothrix alba TaxID=664784 RepID=A0A238YCV3_9PSEU|nr:hypothetical protein SAMN06265360_114103 [Haloechinothrix alba]
MVAAGRRVATLAVRVAVTRIATLLAEPATRWLSGLLRVAPLPVLIGLLGIAALAVGVRLLAGPARLRRSWLLWLSRVTTVLGRTSVLAAAGRPTVIVRIGLSRLRWIRHTSPPQEVVSLPCSSGGMRHDEVTFHRPSPSTHHAAAYSTCATHLTRCRHRGAVTGKPLATVPGRRVGSYPLAMARSWLRVPLNSFLSIGSSVYCQNEW